MERRLFGALLLGTIGLAMNATGSDEGTSETATPRDAVLAVRAVLQ
jgi:hypothetical protein